MKRLTLIALAIAAPAAAQQAPNAQANIPVSGKDRFYTSDHFSNTMVPCISYQTSILHPLRVVKPGVRPSRCAKCDRQTG